ncbi:MAG: hypothetical protein H0X38_16290, partial [Planctomycetes bacterium]|nr:hypothetical protein [Planctomycetota bacterium]
MAIDEALLLRPGAAHPHPPLGIGELARFLHVAPLTARRWIDQGLPRLPDGRIDPFTAANWLAWGHLDECPTLARRWRSYLTFFAPFAAGQERARHLRWTRHHRLCLPGPLARLDWWLPLVPTRPGQQVHGVQVLAGRGLVCTAHAAFLHLHADSVDSSAEVSGTLPITLVPRTVLPAGAPGHAELAALVTEVAGDFRYEYRHHDVGEYDGALGWRAGAVVLDASRVPTTGSCLDLALTLAARLTARSRPWRLCSGLIAATHLANPHFWIEAEPAQGGEWIPLDPTLPALVRMMGGEWRALAARYAGSCDARRVCLRVGDPLAREPLLAGIPGG